MLIFLGGVHGSGKTTFLNELDSVFTFERLSASDLIKWDEYSNNPIDKRVRSIKTTQARLLTGLRQIDLNKKDYILDGHYSLLTLDSLIQPVEVKIFKEMNIGLFMLKTEDPIVVQERLMNRDGGDHNLEFIRKFCEIEYEHFKNVGSILNIPTIVVGDQSLTALASMMVAKM